MSPSHDDQWTTPDDWAWLAEQLRDDDRLDEPIAAGPTQWRDDLVEILDDEGTEAYSFWIENDNPAGQSLCRWRGRYFFVFRDSCLLFGPVTDPTALVREYFSGLGAGDDIVMIDGEEWDYWLLLSLETLGESEVPVLLKDRAAVLFRNKLGGVQWEFADNGRSAALESTLWVAADGRWVRM